MRETWQGSANYQIKVRGKLGTNWSDWFGGMKIESEGAVTTLTGYVSDQPALHGLLAVIRDLGLPLISLQRFDSDENGKF